MPKSTVRDSTAANCELSHIACKCCKKAHKKDRTLDKCTRCKKKNLECIYDKVDRRKKPENHAIPPQLVDSHSSNSSNGSTNLNSTSAMHENDLVRHAVTGKTIDVYICIISIGIPYFKPEEFHKFLEYSVEELNGNRKDVLALLLSIQMTCEQIFGFPDLAEQTVQKCKNIVMHVFDDFSNPLVACTYLNMSIYYAAEGNVEMGKGYVALVENFISRSTLLKAQLFEFELVPKYNCEFSITSLKIGSAIAGLACCDSYPIPDVPVLTKIFSVLSSMNVFHPSYELEFWNNNLNPAVENRINNLEIFSVLAILFENRLSDVSKKLTQVTKEVFYSGLNIIRLVLNSNKIDNTKLEANTKLLEYYALNISSLSENNLFIYMTPYVISFVLSSIKVNFEVCKMIDRGERANLQKTLVLENEVFANSEEVVDYYSVLNRDLHTLRQLAKRYRYITSIYNEVDSFLKNRAKICSSSIQLDGLMNSLSPSSSLFDQPGNIYSEMRTFISGFGKSRNLHRFQANTDVQLHPEKLNSEEDFCNFFGFESPAFSNR